MRLLARRVGLRPPVRSAACRPRPSRTRPSAFASLSRILSVGSARSSASDFTPSPATHSSSFFSRVSSASSASTSLNAPPLSPMAFANSPCAIGDAISVLTANDPALSPKIVTFPASPPNLLDVCLDPLKRGHHVHQPIVPCRPARFFRQVGRGQKAKDPQPVVDGHQHHALQRQKVAVVPRLASWPRPSTRRHESRT